MSRSNNSPVLEIFRPLLRLLRVQHIPDPPGMTIVELADHRNFIVKGMSRCIVILELDDLADKTGGMLITSWKMGRLKNADGTTNPNPVEIYTLHILINRNICNGTSHRDRSYRKITIVHEFTHTIAALCALSRVRTEKIIDRLKVVLHKKAHALNLQDVAKLAIELNEPLLVRVVKEQRKIAIKSKFPDEHYRLGFEQFPFSYPAIYEEFLFSEELFKEYCLPEQIEELCRLFDNDMIAFANLVNPILSRICNEKALFREFVLRRFYLDIFFYIYSDYKKGA